MLVTLPSVLLLIDYWPLGRVQWEVRDPPDSAENADNRGKPRFAPRFVGGLLVEKLPLFALVILSSALTIRAQHDLVASMEAFPFRTRLLNALTSYVAYMGQMCWPTHLAALYPHPRDSLPLGYAAAAGSLLIGITLAALLLARRRPYLIVGWLWYLGTLVPVIGLMQTGVQARADRYTYVPLIGLFILLTWGTADILARWRYHRVVLPAAAGGLVAACAVLTWVQVQYWRDSFILLERAHQVTPHHAQLHYISAMTYLQHDRKEEAIEQLLAQVQVQHNNPASHALLADLFLEQGRIDEAAQHMAILVELKPESPEAHLHLARVLRMQGKSREAVDHVARAARLLDAQAAASAQAGDFQEAVNAVERAYSLARKANQEELANELLERLRCYRERRLYRK
jgi:tetratricopeptide (TPR) repeat protein